MEDEANEQRDEEEALEALACEHLEAARRLIRRVHDLKESGPGDDPLDAVGAQPEQRKDEE